MKKLIFILLLIPLLSFGQYKTVTIKPNRHYPNKVFCPDRGLKVEANIILDENCWYERNGKYNWLNKLFGFHPLFSGVHINSARFVWLPSTSKDSIDIYFYCYVDRVSPQQDQNYKGFIKRVKTGDVHNYKILDYLHRYQFYIDGVALKTLVTYKRKHYDWHFTDGFYSGGPGTLPFEISARYQIVY